VTAVQVRFAIGFAVGYRHRSDSMNRRMFVGCSLVGCETVRETDASGFAPMMEHRLTIG
jgi:hypothetical protein